MRESRTLYSVELLLSRAHYHCSRILVRFMHAWLARALGVSFLQDLLAASSETALVHELRYSLKPDTDVEIRSVEDIHRLPGIKELDEQVRHVIKKYMGLVGYSNIIQSLSARHPLLLLYSVAEGCLREDSSCVLEPSIHRSMTTKRPASWSVEGSYPTASSTCS